MGRAQSGRLISAPHGVSGGAQLRPEGSTSKMAPPHSWKIGAGSVGSEGLSPWFFVCGHLHVDASTLCCGFLRAWWLDSKSKHPKTAK